MKKIFLIALLSSSLLVSCGNSNSCTSKEEQIIYTSKDFYGTMKVVTQDEVYFNYQNILFEYVKDKTELVLNVSSFSTNDYIFKDGQSAKGTITFRITKWANVSETSNSYLHGFEGSPFLSVLSIAD